MSEANEERLGRASFELRREAAVEQSLAKVRHHLGNNWETLSTDEITDLGWMLGEMWASMGFMAWETVGLEKMTLAIADRLVELTRSIRSGAIDVTEGVRSARELL